LWPTWITSRSLDCAARAPADPFYNFRGYIRMPGQAYYVPVL
jgi:hypothetical protein